MAIERKKEEAERALFEAEQMEAQRKAQAQRAHELAEDRRRKEEAARRETVGVLRVGGPAATRGCMEEWEGRETMGSIWGYGLGLTVPFSSCHLGGATTLGHCMEAAHGF